MKVANAGLREAQPQHRLLLRRPGAGDRRIALEPRQPQCLQGGSGFIRKALKLAFQHWIEAIDPRHRYGHNLHFYYDVWCQSQASQPFFYWLYIAEGKDVDLPECPRARLKKQCIKYLGPL